MLGRNKAMFVTMIAANSGAAVPPAPIPIQYIFLDEFTTPDASPVASPRTAEPGPGSWTVTQTAGTAEINAEGQLVLTGANQDFRLTWLWGQNFVPFVPGRALFWDRVSGAPWCRYGYSDATYIALLQMDYSNASLKIGSTTVLMPTLTYEKFGIIRTSTRIVYLGFDGTNWIFLWEDYYLNVAYNYYLSFDNMSTTESILDNIEVHDVGAPYTSDYGLATNRVASPTDGETTTSTADAIISITWTPGANEIMTLMFRRTDDDNCWKVECDLAGDTIKLFKRESGSDTEYAAGQSGGFFLNTAARISVILEGTNIYTYVDNARKNVYASAAFNLTATGVKAAGFATATDLICYPRIAPSLNNGYGDNSVVTGTFVYSSTNPVD